MAKRTAEERFWEKVNQDGPIPNHRPELGPCWLWTGNKTRQSYGRFHVSRGKQQVAHRWCYEQTLGAVPDGLQLDHLCRVTSCVRPSHLEPVTCRENLLRGNTFQARNARKTHCPNGHPYDLLNTRWRPDGKGRECRQCGKDRHKQAPPR